MFASIPPDVAIWLFNAVISIAIVFGGIYFRRLQSDLKEAETIAKSAKDKAVALTLELMQYKIDCLTLFAVRTDAETTKLEILSKLDYLTRRIDAYLERPR
jgi:hypothetical protein